MVRLTPLLACLVLCAVTPFQASAQAKLSLLDGKNLRGEVLRETAELVEFVDMDGARHEVGRDQVKKLDPGKPFKKKILARLDGIDMDDPEAVFVVAAWAFEQSSSLRTDAKRLARRVLGFRPDHEGAHLILGQVFALGEWHKNERTAERAVKKKMTAEGRVRHDDGWARKEDLDAIKSAPDDWMIVEMIWRSRAEVMAEKGMISWLGAWYPPEDAAMVKQLEELRERTGLPAHGAQRGGNTVILDGSRLAAEAIAADLESARQWVLDTFKPMRKGELRKDLLDQPLVQTLIFKSPEDLTKYGVAYKSTFTNMTEDYFKRCIAAGELRFGSLDMATNTANKPRWREAAVGRVAAGLLYFSSKRNFEMPLWLKMAVSHHAEYGVFGGKSSYFFITPDTPPSTLSEERRQLIILFESGEAPRLGPLLIADDFLKMAPEDETMATVFLEFLLKKKFDSLQRYFYDGKVTGNAKKVFAATLGADPAVLERELANWLGVELED